MSLGANKNDDDELASFFSDEAEKKSLKKMLKTIFLVI